MSIQLYFDTFRQLECANTVNLSIYSSSTTVPHGSQRHLPASLAHHIRLISFQPFTESRLTPLFQYVGIRSRRISHDAPEKDDHWHGDIDFIVACPRTGCGHGE